MIEQAKQSIETYMDNYPDVPREVILKEDMLRLGIQFSEDALEMATGCRPKSYYLFSWDRMSRDEMEKDESYRTPDDIFFHGGPYDLRLTNVRVEIAQKTPYLVSIQNGKPLLFEGFKPIAEIKYPKRPHYYSYSFEDGTSYGQVIPLLFGRMAFVTMYRLCQFSPEEQCRFCDMNASSIDLKARAKGVRDRVDIEHVVYDTIKDPEQVATVAEAMYRDMFLDKRENLENRMISIIMTAGTIKKTLKGLNRVDFYLQYVNAIRKKIGNRIPIVLIVEALPDDDMWRLYEGGVTVYNPNIEVWDKRLFEILCPGKARYFGRDKWIEQMLKAVDIFGVGNVSPNFVAGVEMAQPMGFKDVDEAVDSTREGFEFMMSRGIIPHPDSWCIEPQSPLGAHPAIPLDYYIKMNKAWYDTWTKYALPPNNGWGPIGNGCGCYGNSGYVDMREGRL
jgi:hypothetical protein